MRLCLKMAAMLLGAALAHAALAVGDFALIDQHGVFHQLSRYNERNAVVIFVQRNGDRVSRDAVPVLRDLRERFSSQGVVFLMLNASDDRDSVRQEATENDIDFPIMLDSAQVVARTVGAHKTGEVFIIDPDSYQQLYYGSIGETDSLSLALTAIVSGGQVSASVPADIPANGTADDAADTPGSAIHFTDPRSNPERKISYLQEIVPLLQRNCTSCHIEDGLAPWAMSSYIMILGWSPMIRETVITRRMPPGQIDTSVGEWSDIHRMTDEDQALLLAWIDDGALKDGSHDPLTDERPEPVEWPLGEPDLIVNVPEEQVPATGIIDFRLKRASFALSEDKWLRAVSYNVGDRSVLHSLLVYELDNDARITEPADLIDEDKAAFISLYVPGKTEDVFAADTGYLLSKGKDLVFKIRYTSSGRATVDRTRIGLYFRDGPPELALRTLAIENRAIQIPANEENHREFAETDVVADEFFIESFSPHAHNRSKSMTVSAHYPDGSKHLLINVANYNFNWQMTYTLQQRAHIPAGLRIISETVYDNTAANPHNPDPDKAVQWGVSTWDEMFSHFVRIAEPVRN